VAPTSGAGAWPEPVLEVHFLGGPPPEIPPGPLSAAFLRFVRPEARFGSLEDLRRQIAADCGIISGHENIIV